MYLIIRRRSNSFGIGCELSVETNDGRCYPAMCYYGYGTEKAIRKYRREYGLQRRHLTRIEI